MGVGFRFAGIRVHTTGKMCTCAQCFFAYMHSENCTFCVGKNYWSIPKNDNGFAIPKILYSSGHRTRAKIYIRQRAYRAWTMWMLTANTHRQNRKSTSSSSWAAEK